MIGVVVSRADSASDRIGERLLALADWEAREDDSLPDADGGGRYYRTDGFELRTFDDLHLELERPADAFSSPPELVIFVSRHAGDTGPLLTGHFTGNVGPAEYGGDDHALARAAPNALARLLERFDEHAPDGYETGLECTHHGPTDVGAPSLFAELGSDEAQWNDPDGAAAVARAVLDLEEVSPHRERQVVGVGGNHYVPRFERIVRETPWAVGHVAADWALEDLDDPAAHRDVVERLFSASETEFAVVDGEWSAVEETIEELGFRIVSETWLREVGDRPLALVERVEAELGSIESGVRFGDVRPNAEDPAAIDVVDVPPELVGAAEGIDPDRVRRVVERRTAAFETTDGGSRIGERAAVADGDAREELVDALADVLREKYDAVRVAADTVVAEETAFDPELAREAGVQEGPAFGKLADGRAVTVDGETIEPEDVHAERTRRFPI